MTNIENVRVCLLRAFTPQISGGATKRFRREPHPKSTKFVFEFNERDPDPTVRDGPQAAASTGADREVDGRDVAPLRELGNDLERVETD